MTQKERKGVFVGLFGPNNLGKTTASKNLVGLLINMGVDATYLKYALYNLEPTGPRLNSYLRDGNPEHLTALEAQTIFARNRHDFEPELLNMLHHGKVVVAEDYADTGRAWGMANNIPLSTMDSLNRGLRVPDIKIYLDGDRFPKSIETGHLHEGNPEMWLRSRKIHLALARRSHSPIVNANQPPEVVAQELLELVKPIVFRKK